MLKIMPVTNLNAHSKFFIENQIVTAKMPMSGGRISKVGTNLRILLLTNGFSKLTTNETVHPGGAAWHCS